MGAVTGSLLDDLVAAGGAARAAGADDAVDGVVPSYVVSPATTAATAEVMRVAAQQGLAVVARGRGTKLSWGAPPARVDLVLDTTRMARVLEHAAGDLVVHVQAGLPLADLQSAVAPADQRLAVDPVVAGGTVGGLVATGVSGPLRHSHGAVRDLLIGVTMVRADGVVAKAGGKVVKNVAGYDLAKLLAGSWGTLGVVTEAVFRLHPLPESRRWVTVPVREPAAAHELVQRVIHSQLVPSAVELDQPVAGDGELSVLVEGIAAGVAGRTAGLLDLLGPAAREDDRGPAWWGQAPWSPGDVALRLTHEIAGLPLLLDAVRRRAGTAGLPVAVRGAAGLGVLHAGLPGGGAGAVAGLVAGLRKEAAGWGGDVVVLDGPAPVKAAVDVWGPVRGLALMRRVKDGFDPEHRLSPGRFVGGL